MIKLLFVLISQASWVAGPVVVKDLKAEWLEYKNGVYAPAVQVLPEVHSVYFPLGASAFKGQYLSVSSSERCSLFVNGKLIVSGKHHYLSLDSLSALYSDALFIGIHGEPLFGNLSTQIVSPLARSDGHDEYMSRSPAFFRDYSVIATAILLLFFLILYRTSPQLTYDYFSFAKIFSVQERNENLLASRITSGENLLFYVFCAMLTGFLLSGVLYFADFYFRVEKFYGIASLGGAFSAWFKLSLFVLTLLTAKLIIVLIFSSLFSFRETISFQFFNFLRFVLFTAVVMALLSLFYFVFKGDQPLFYERLIILGLVLLSVGSVMVLIKLLARAPFSFFHLFSYLCASEIIPLVIIIKIFF